MNKIQAVNKIIKLAKYLAKSGSMRMAGAKYILTDATQKVDGCHIVHRVQYSNGKLGGWIESEKNLQGNAKVLDEAKVYGDAVVKDNAVVCDIAYVTGDSVIKDKACIYDYAKVVNSTFTGTAGAGGSAFVLNSQVGDRAIINGKANVQNAYITDYAGVFSNAYVNNSIIKQAHILGGTVKDSIIKCKGDICGTVLNSILSKDRNVEKGETIKNVKE